MEKRPFTFDEAEFCLRRVLSEEGYAQPDPDAIKPGPYEVSFVWLEEELMAIVDRREGLNGNLLPVA